MQPLDRPITQDLVLIGGGHSHAIALKKFGMNPLPGVRLTLITDVYHTPYSGMLPAYVAGFYDFDECHIDLHPLAQFAQAQLIADRAIGLDLQQNRVICANHPPIAFDVLSIDIGSTPSVANIPGAEKHAIPVKPISQFLVHWEHLVSEVQQFPDRPLHVGIVGGGVGGVELALNVQAHLHQIYRATNQPIANLTIHLFHRGAEVLEERSAWVRRQLHKILVERHIQVHLSEEVMEIGVGWVKCRSGLTVECDRTFWVTQASAAPWLRESGLATDKHGFIQINDYLQSPSHPQVFAAGDVASMLRHPRPKAGVFAVRQGKPLFDNLRRFIQHQPLRPFVPQKEFLSLIGLGNGTAIASRGAFGFGPNPLLWRWKDHIDRKFMHQFVDLLAMGEGRGQKAEGRRGDGGDGGVYDTSPSSLPSPSSAPSTHTPHPTPHTPFPNTPHPTPHTPFHCTGCGSKVGRSVLERTLQRIRQDNPQWVQRDDVLIGLDDADDAAVIRVPAQQVMVQTVDYFRALINDPFLFGQISTNHCLSDLFAMGAQPQSALAIAAIPYASEAKTEETLYQLLSGAVQVLSQIGASLIGGHTVEDASLAFGLTCNGLAEPEHLLRKSGMQPDQTLILTKALGTGSLFAADMRLKARGRWIESAIQSMLLSNRAAADIFREHQATACTDITGFGLLGHLLEMVQASQVSVTLQLDILPVLDGARETLAQGIFSSIYPQNVQAAQFIQNLEEVSDRPFYPLLFDPQTSGGLLAAVPSERAAACLDALNHAGYIQSRMIGYTLPAANGVQPVTIEG